MEPKKEKKKGHNWKKGTSIQLTKQEPSGRNEQARPKWIQKALQLQDSKESNRIQQTK
jgi:hypothetical protein